MVTVIIPTLNEQNTIAQVIQLVKKSPLVSEILVIDDKSLDNTIKNAKFSINWVTGLLQKYDITII